jgi:hypothetical protein
MKKLFLTLSIGLVILITSCGEQVVLDPVALEQQYVELTPYWNGLFDQKYTNKTAAIVFSKHYQEARDILNYYYDPSRRNDKTAPSDTELLWNLRLELRYASERTNQLTIGE